MNNSVITATAIGGSIMAASLAFAAWHLWRAWHKNNRPAVMYVNSGHTCAICGGTATLVYFSPVSRIWRCEDPGLCKATTAAEAMLKEVAE